MIDCPQLFHNDCQSLMSKIDCPRNFRRICVVAHCMKLWSRLMSSDGLRWWSQKTDLKTHVEKGFALVQAQRLQISYNDDLSGHFWNRQLCLAIIHDSMKLRAVAPSGCFCHLPACQRKVEEVAKILLHRALPAKKAAIIDLNESKNFAPDLSLSPSVLSVITLSSVPIINHFGSSATWKKGHNR